MSPLFAFLNGVDPWIFTFAFITVVVTIGMGFWSATKSKTTSDFFVAGRSVSVGWNASAISGEYLSAASFMGIAGMVMANGYDVLWYPVCYACGYLFLLLFIAGPLRRFGAYTIPDFAEGRYDSPVFRKIAVCFVLFIGFVYTMPQMKGAGVTLAYIFPGMPYWGGVALVGAVITLNVALGGMKGITLVQAFQYWMKMFAISVPVFVLMAVFGFYNGHLGANAAPGEAAAPVAAADVSRQPLVEKAPKDAAWIAPFGPLTTKAVGAAAAKIPAGEQRNAYVAEHQRPYSLLYTYSLIIALVCGTAGLPHILVRFYTNPDGGAAKRTTMWVMILIGVFYVFPPIFGVLGRNLTPDLYTGVGAKGTDKVVLELPRAVGGVLGSIMSGITCAGAFAAFMSTFSGLLVSMTGAFAHDIYGRMLRPNARPAERLFMFKVGAVVIGAIAIGLGTQVETMQINFMVNQAFAIAASSYFPLLFMSVWWRGMTMTGAATGMLGGGLAALACTGTIILGDIGKVNLADFWAFHPLARILVEQPAIWTMPLSIILMVVVSKLTAANVPANIRMKMLVLHAPEQLGLKQEYIQEQTAGAGH